MKAEAIAWMAGRGDIVLVVVAVVVGEVLVWGVETELVTEAEARCLREKRARKRRARGVDSD